MNELVFIEPDCIKSEPFTKSGVVTFGMKRVYVLKSKSGLVKIGVSGGYGQRKRALETQSGFDMEASYCTEPLNNYSRIESMSHKQFKHNLKMGEWFDIEFDEAVKYVKTLCNSIGDYTVNEYKKPDVSSMFPSLPTAMEELMRDEPILYDWFIKNGYELFYRDSNLWVRCEGLEDMTYSFFTAVTLWMARGCGRYHGQN